MRFIDNKDGTIIDTQTGLMWEKIDNKQPKQVTIEEFDKWILSKTSAYKNSPLYCEIKTLAKENNWIKEPEKTALEKL